MNVYPRKLAKLISEKLGPRVRKNYFPPEPDKLYAEFGARSAEERDAISRIAISFMQTLLRTTVDERSLIAHIFAEGCRTQLPDNVHISLDIVRRDLDITPAAVVESMRGMTSLGFTEEIRTDEDHGDDVIVVRWIDAITYGDDLTDEFSTERATEVAVRMLDVGVGDDGCLECERQCIEELDFSLLASATSGGK